MSHSELTGHWDGPWYRVDGDGFSALFLLDPDEDPALVDGVDVVVELADGTRWTGTLFTLASVQRRMAEDAETGESLDGRYFWRADSLIVRDPGVGDMTRVLAGLIDFGDLTRVLRRVDAEDLDDAPDAAR
ncbi:hypothetical protein DFP74_4879 [Nocardiopsis sp. Huas11]|uniref:hypothetical protein n=1 Tax=Nocardiopsis sp. Huas11 TaxID=2183912 RepID=UPI000EB30988|nr:hypothetical protein [Nocardiopsis sp. Huas11]RKS09150.1 hypothetical protein DFP74_4879 [Nocardiopsis sp. Huas11]